MKSSYWETEEWLAVNGVYGCWGSEHKKHPWKKTNLDCQYGHRMVDTRCRGCVRRVDDEKQEGIK